MTRTSTLLIVAGALALAQGIAAQGQAPAPGRGGAGFGAPADAPPPRTVTPGPQALAVSRYPRITTTGIWNSGALPADSKSPAIGQTAGNKESLTRLHAPIACFIGGPSDVAYPNAEDDFARITRVPVFKASLNVGHGGTYRQPGGGWFGEVAVAWLDYQLKGSAEAGKWFVGPDCRLCTDPVWTVQKKGMR